MKMVAETVGVPLYMPEWPEPVPEARTRNGAGRVGGDWEPVCDPLCGCGHVTCPWCFIAAKRFDTDTVLTAIRRHYDEGYALAVLTGDWAGRGGEQRRIRRHHARYVRLRLDEARYLVLATAPVPGCGPPLSKLGCAALALRTIREAPFGHQPWLLGNSDFLELDDRGKPFAIPHDPDLGAWHAEVLAPHVAQHGTPDLPPLPVAPPAEPMQVVVSSGRYEG